MNGVHDMGGMQGMGPVVIEKNEPVFHAPWEGRIYVLSAALGAWRKWNLDASRSGIESIPAADYLNMSYYQKWLETIAGRYGENVRVKIERCLADEVWSKDGFVDPAAWTMAQNVVRGAGLLAQEVPYADVIDMRFVQH